MPVLYVAVGRRLGYPLKLVESRGHLFFRWDDPLGRRLGIAERFNVEGAGSGIASYPDDYYRTWPEPWTSADKAGGMYLTSLSAREELAAFLSTRAECLHDNDRMDEAMEAYHWACKLAPNDPRYRWRLGQIIWRLQRNIFEINEVIAMNWQARLLAGQGAIGNIRGAAAPPSSPPHGDYCQCFHCQQARSKSNEATLPGHLHNCRCPYCQVRRQTVMPTGTHPPRCSCVSCRHPRALAFRPLGGQLVAPGLAPHEQQLTPARRQAAQFGTAISANAVSLAIRI